MLTRSNNGGHVVPPAEVMGWLQSYGVTWPADAVIEIAERLSQMRWAGDPEPDPPEVVDSPAVGDVDWERFQIATDAAKKLQTNIPALLQHWESLRWDPQTSGGYDAIKAVEQALLTAQHWIEFPFGEYEKVDHRSKP